MPKFSSSLLECVGCGISFFAQQNEIVRGLKWCSMACRDNKAHALKYVDKSGGPDACWPWSGFIENHGYGRFGHALAHRVVYELLVGPIPEGLDLLHRCDNNPCCNPAHLFPGTHLDNMRDMSAKGRTTRAITNNILSPTQALEIYLSDEPTKVVAERFGVSYYAAWDVRAKRSWRVITAFADGTAAPL